MLLYEGLRPVRLVCASILRVQLRNGLHALFFIKLVLLEVALIIKEKCVEGIAQVFLHLMLVPYALITPTIDRPIESSPS